MPFRIAEGEDERTCDCALDAFKCNTGGCIPNHYVCDGTPHCPDFSDEWDCFSINNTEVPTPNQSDDEPASGKTQLHNVLKMKGADGQYSFVCADRWQKTHADTVCKELGFTSSLSWSQVHLAQPDMRFYKMRSENLTENFLTNFNWSTGCDDGIISLECQSYCKFSRNTLNNKKRPTNFYAFPQHAATKLRPEQEF